MIPHAPIFVSATSKDLGEARNLVVRVLNGIGYACRVQPGFAFTGEDLRGKLRGLIEECGLVIQLVETRALKIRGGVPLVETSCTCPGVEASRTSDAMTRTRD